MKNKLPEIFGSIIDDLGKYVDSKNIFQSILQNNDEILSASIWGKIIQKLAEKGLSIQDINEAYNTLIVSASLTTIFEAMEIVNITINNIPIPDPIDHDYRTFDINKIDSNELVCFYKEHFYELLENRLENDLEKIPFVKNHIDNYLKLNILKLLEEESLLYKQFSAYYKSSTYCEEKRILLNAIYEEKIALDFYSIVLNDSACLTLHDLYIEPSFKVHKKNLDTRTYTSKLYKRIPNFKFHDFIIDVFNKKNPHFIKEDEINTIFIAGYPGQGKSSFCKAFVNAQIKNKHLKENIALIKLKDIDEPKKLLDDIEGTIKKYIEYDEDNLENYIIVLDGLDELYMKSSLTLHEIDQICHRLIRSNFKVILTTRYQYIDFGLFDEKNCLALGLGELSKEQQKEWLNKYSSYHPNLKLTSEKLDQLHENRDKFIHVIELIEQPILLHIGMTPKQ
jgi:hypothetical protein